MIVKSQNDESVPPLASGVNWYAVILPLQYPALLIWSSLDVFAGVPRDLGETPVDPQQVGSDSDLQPIWPVNSRHIQCQHDAPRFEL